MRIAYLISHDITKNDGVTKKILDQTEEWERLGVEIKIFCQLPKKGKSILLNTNQYIYKGAIRGRIFLENNLINDIDKFNPDIVYFRYDTWNITLAKILRNYKTIVELNTYDLGEFWMLFKQQKTLKSLLRYLIYKFLRSKILNNVSGIIAVTKEIAEHKSNTIFNKPTTFIPNGINLEKYSIIKNLTISDKINFFFIGTPNQPWHGVDKIVEIAEKLQEYNFHLVGIEGNDKNNLFYHGYLQKEDYLKILNKCQICIGSLSLYKNKMYEACPLKVREYLSYGFPIILGYKDTAFIDKVPSYILNLDLENTKINENLLKQIKDFAELNKTFVVEKNEINFIDIKHLEKERFSFFKKIINLKG